MLTILLNHPGLFDAVGETLGGLAFRQPAQERLRRELVAALAANSALDAEGLRVHLSRHGCSEMVESLLSGVTESYARPGADADAALRGWQHAYRILQREQLFAELRTIDPATTEGMARIEAINAEIARAVSVEGDLED